PQWHPERAESPLPPFVDSDPAQTSAPPSTSNQDDFRASNVAWDGGWWWGTAGCLSASRRRCTSSMSLSCTSVAYSHRGHSTLITCASSCSVITRPLCAVGDLGWSN